MSKSRLVTPIFCVASLVVSAAFAGDAPLVNGVMTFDSAKVRSVDGTPAREGSASARSIDYGRELRLSGDRIPESARHRLAALTERERETARGQGSLSSRAEGRLLIGVTRNLPVAVRLPGIEPGAAKSAPVAYAGGFLERMANGSSIWTASFSSAGADGVRLRLDDVLLPAGSRVFIYGSDGEAHGPYTFDKPAAWFWTNAVYSPEVFLEVQLPAGADSSSLHLTIATLGHIQQSLGASPEALSGCFVDVSCETESDLPGLAAASRAVAEMIYQDGGSMWVCSGALINTSSGNARPFFLTANHCISTPDEALSLEAYWDFRTTTCGGLPPSRSSVPRSLGASLLATGSQASGTSDFSLLELTQAPPPTRYYLGWTTDDYSHSDGVEVFRIAHPDGAPQQFSKHVISGTPTPGACSGLDQGTFIYSRTVTGATKGGASGSPVFIAAGLRIVGQLFGRCGQNLDDPCDLAKNSAVDGSFRTSFASLSRWLDTGGDKACAPSATTLCLFNGRFQVTLSARDQRTGDSGSGTAMPQNDVFGYFSLPELTHQPDNPEVFVKVLDGRPLGGKFWVFYGGLTDLEFDLVVVDTVTGASKTYRKAGGSFCGNADTNAF